MRKLDDCGLVCMRELESDHDIAAEKPRGVECGFFRYEGTNVGQWHQCKTVFWSPVGPLFKIDRVRK